MLFPVSPFVFWNATAIIGTLTVVFLSVRATKPHPVELTPWKLITNCFRERESRYRLLHLDAISELKTTACRLCHSLWQSTSF